MERGDDRTNRRATVLAAAAVVALVAFAAYGNTLHVPFLLDDEVTILGNPSIRHLGDLGAVLQPPAHVFSAGRPLLNFSFALNYALGGTSETGYHVVNVVIHVLSCLLLFGIVCRTLQLPQFRWGNAGTPSFLAVAVASLWGLHPLLTATVAYVSQRAESLMALFYLLTLYGFIRAATAQASRTWTAVSVAACLLGTLTKEVIVTAPILMLLYDRAFVSGSLLGGLRLRAGLYAGYVAAWACLAWLMITSHIETRGVGFVQGVSSWSYGLAEMRVLVRYAALAVWPHPLVFDYGAEFFTAPPIETVCAALLVCTGIAATIYAWRRSMALGFVAGAFFLILAPTSSVVPIALQPMAENRMYLPLAAVTVLLVLAVHVIVGGRRACALGIGAALGLAALTVLRNADYRSAEKIWADTVAKCSGSSRAHNNLGLALQRMPGRNAEAMAHFRAALCINPDFPEAHNNLGIALANESGRLPEAIAQFEAALRVKPAFAQAHTNLANALLRQPDRLTDAIAHYRAALGLQPANGSFHANLADALANDPGHRAEAISHFETAVRLEPNNTAAHTNFARLLAQMPDRRSDAASHYEAALQLEPRDAETHYNFANLLAADAANLPEAIRHYEAALHVRPDLGAARNNLAIALYRMGRLDDAIAELENAVSRDASNADAQKNLEKLRAMRARQ